MYYNLGKKIFRFFIDLIQFVRLILVFLSFAVIIFWLFQLGGATFIQPVTPFFESIKSVIHIIYRRTVVIDGLEVDFSYLVATIIMMFSVLGLKFVVEQIEKVEKKYDSIYRYLKKKNEDLFNLNLQQQYIFNEKQNNKLLLLVNFEAKNLLQDSFFTRDINVGVDEMQKQILMEFANMMEKQSVFENKYLNDGLLFYFKSFGDIDKIVSDIEKVAAELRHKYIADKWQVAYHIGVEVYAKETDVISKTKNLIMLIRLGLPDKILCLSSFKQRYQLKENKKFKLEGCGVYTINETEEEAFCIKKLR